MKDKPIKSVEEYKFHCNACYGNPSSTEGCFTDDVTTTTTSCKENGLWGKEIQPIWNSNPLRLSPVYVPTFGAGCAHSAHQTDDNGDEVICFCSHDGNEEDTEGNCRREVCPKQQATVFGKVAEQLKKENKMENKIIKFGKMLFVDESAVYAMGAVYSLSKTPDIEGLRNVQDALGDDPVDVLEFTEFLKAQRPKIDDKAFYDAAIAFVQDNQAEFYEIMHRNYSMNNSDFDKAIGNLLQHNYSADSTSLPDILTTRR